MADGTRIGSIDGDATAAEDPLQQIDERGLPGAGRADNSHPPAPALSRKTRHGRPDRVRKTEGNVVENDVAP